MEWLLLLACPLMMLFCMKGMMGGNKEKKHESANSKAAQGPNEVQGLQIKMAELMEQNNKLMNEVQSLKESQASNDIIELKDKQKVEKKRDIS